ncbi:MAG: helix-turn-helix transcriptional regulator [Paucibacter sp.]|nr:helix-turn-helix transcriptional regulator [Roseateles sp.]
MANLIGGPPQSLTPRAGTSPEELSERLLIDPKSMARIERGGVLPSLQRVFEMSEALGVPLNQLLGEASPSDEDLVVWLGQRVQCLSEEDRSRVLDLIERLAR